MTTLNKMKAEDLLRVSFVNLDKLTETVSTEVDFKSAGPHMSGLAASLKLTYFLLRCPLFLYQYNLGFYLQYMAKWPEYYLQAKDCTNRCVAYSEQVTQQCSIHIILILLSHYH